MGKKKKSNGHKPHVKKKQPASLTPDKGTHVQRTHKDTLFRFIFRDKKNLLQLYNALNGSDYQDENSLHLTTLENVIYLGYKNDVSFLLDCTLFLAEHQTTVNPNMPLRGVLYFARLYQDFDGEIPFPPALECKALVLNINYGQNRMLMEKCRPLWEYSYFVHHIRENLKTGYTPEKAVDLAVTHCLQEGILKDLLKKHSKEVVGMFLEEYDKELHEKTLRNEGWTGGRKVGVQKGRNEWRKLTQLLLEDNRLDDLRRSTKDKKFEQQLMKEYNIE